MMIFRSSRRALGVCAAVALLAGCGGPTMSLGTSPIAPQGATAPNAAAGDLLYVTGACGGTCEFSYPAGKPGGSLSVSGASLCSDSKGNVFMPTATSGETAVVYEYAHGGTKPIATLNLSGLLAEGCSVDPTTGNLAVTYLCHYCDYAPVAIFKKARGTPKSYEASGVFLSFCGYDDKGNLFVDGSNGSQVELLELAKAGRALTSISLGQKINVAGAVQWDGTYLAIEDLINPVIYQFKVKGSSATLAGTTALTGAGGFASQSWIQGSTVIVPFAATGSTPNAVGFWNYPAGGKATKVIQKKLGSGAPAGATISVK